MVALGSGAAHKLVVRGGRVRVALRVTDQYGGLARKRFRLSVADAVVEGTLPDDGLVEVSAPVDATTGLLELWLRDDRGVEPLRIPLEIGALQPESFDEGAVARLGNLGFAGADAVRGFQQAIGVKPTGELDETTRGHLRRASEEP
jgi:hypothetical protein